MTEVGTFQIQPSCGLGDPSYMCQSDIKSALSEIEAKVNAQQYDEAIDLMRSSAISIGTINQKVIPPLINYCFDLDSIDKRWCLTALIEGFSEYSIEKIAPIFKRLTRDKIDHCSDVMRYLSYVKGSFSKFEAVKAIVDGSLIKGDYSCAISALPNLATTWHRSLISFESSLKWLQPLMDRVAEFCLNAEGSDCAERLINSPLSEKWVREEEFLKAKSIHCSAAGDTHCVETIKKIQNIISNSEVNSECN